MILANTYRIRTLFVEYNEILNNNEMINDLRKNKESLYEQNTNF
jgi:hypothetical protein